MTKVEGVAAPLEPSPDQFEEWWNDAGFWRINGDTHKYAAQMAWKVCSEKAAAVSKNLTDMLNSSDAGHTVTVNKLIAAEFRIEELEKEITALREKK